MKKATKITVTMLLLVATCAALFTGCGPQALNPEDDTKSKLIVNNYAGGFGADWLNNVEKRFEEAYANVSFEAGKVGVDVVINHNKDQGETYLSKIDAMEDEVFFPGNIYYHEWVTSGKMLDITDVITGTNDADGGKSILDKMTQEEKDFYSVNGAYYAIPHHESQPGVVYDKDLFEAKGLYFAKNGAPSEDYALDKDTVGGYSGVTAYTGKGEKSAGPDGLHGTSDDGLPATYEEFFTLCEYMMVPSVGVTPFIWTGKTKGYYTDLLMAALAADYEGAEQLAMQYSYTGTATNLISIDANGNITELPDEAITVETGYRALYVSPMLYNAIEDVPVVKDEATGEYKLTDESLDFTGIVPLWAAMSAKVHAKPWQDESNAAAVEILNKLNCAFESFWIWDYAVDFRDYFVPYNIFDNLEEDFKFLQQYNISLYLYQLDHVGGNCSSFGGLKAYLLSQLMWDADQDVEALTDKYFTYVYGDGAEAMRDIYESLLNLWEYNTVQHGDTSPWDTGIYSTAMLKAEYYPRGTLREWLDLIDQAYEAIEPLKTANPNLYSTYEYNIRMESIFVRYIYAVLYLTANNNENIQFKLALYQDVADNFYRVSEGGSTWDFAVTLGIDNLLT